MIKRCPQCRVTVDPLVEHLKMIMGEAEDNETLAVQFSRWTMTDRSTLVQQQETVADYINLIVLQLQKLTSHSYIAKCQILHLQKERKS